MTDKAKRRPRLGAAGLMAFTLCGCATITTGADQSVVISTDPSGAECTLDRAGLSLAVVDPTPGTVNIDKSKNAISIVCRKEGFMPSTGVLSSEFQGMTFGNIIFGGLIGVAVDAGSGAMNEYPDQIAIQLIPESFASTTERDRFFDAAAERARTRHAEAVAHVEERCVDDDGCPFQVQKVQAAGDAELAKLEQQRIAAVIEP